MPTPDANAEKISLRILFTQGFRIFFALAGIWSVVAMAAWLAILAGMEFDGGAFPLSWHHGHEMVFGFTAAAAAGFMLTATPVWSNTPPLTGLPLAGLFVAWTLGRLGVIFSWIAPPWLAALADGLFFVGFLTFITPTLWFTGNRVHRIFPVLLGMMALGDLLFHLEALSWTRDTAHAGLLLGQNAIIFFLVMTGGHIMPMFTRAELKARGEEIPFAVSPLLEMASAVTLTLLVGADLFFPGRGEAGWVFLAAGLLQGVRLSRWHGHKTLRTPLLWVLHLGYLWLVMGLLLRGMARLSGVLDDVAALHALSVGAMGLFTLGIMSRISLTHTGRSVKVGAPMIMAFGLMAAGAVARVFVYPGIGWALWLSGGLWIASYVLFCMVFLPILSADEPVGKAG